MRVERPPSPPATRGEVGTSPVPSWVTEFNWPSEKTTVTVDDILAGRAPRPRVLDMFAGGGAIPLEALRLGCEAYALDLNPVAHIIQLCTLVYPQKYGKPDSTARGMTGPKNTNGETTWGGLAAEVRYWGEWVLRKVKGEIGDLYPLIPDPEYKGKRQEIQTDWLRKNDVGDVPRGYLTPVAYLWTRTVTCKNPTCKATVPLVKQTWLCKKEGRYVALKVVAPRGKKQVRFEVVEARTENGLGFDPTGFSKGGNATCPFCGTVADSDYVKAEGCADRMQAQMMAIACSKEGKQGKVYLAGEDLSEYMPDDLEISARIEMVCRKTGLSEPEEPIINDAKNANFCVLYGRKQFRDLFTRRQMLSLLSFSDAVRKAAVEMSYCREASKAVATLLAAIVDRLADFNSSLCTWNYTGGRGVLHTYARQALPMIWDYAETNVFNPDAASWVSGIEDVPAALEGQNDGVAARVARGSATELPWGEDELDAVVTDPPYYDNVPYADISDFFFVWLKRTIGTSYQEHFATNGTPKKQEAVADATRHAGSKERARAAYESMMMLSFREAHRVLKQGGQLSVVYAHKTTLGWATLVDAMRNAGFTVTEAWPLDTEKPGRLRSMESAALASSIFLVARKREGTSVGNYEEQVRPELETIVRERVTTLWDMGISGADLVIACVGAGLRAFTQYGSVEYANGQEVPAERFLAEVESVVLDSILARLSKEIGPISNGRGRYSLAGLDAATRFYVLWRYTYKAADLEAGEAIIFANGTHVELDGPDGLATDSNAILEKKKAKYRLRDFAERGDDDDLGLPEEDGEVPPTIDALHRLLWLLEHKPPRIPEFLADAGVSTEQLRLVAQALAGPALKGGELADVSPSTEQSALGKLLSNWNAVVGGKGATADRQRGQGRFL